MLLADHSAQSLLHQDVQRIRRRLRITRELRKELAALSDAPITIIAERLEVPLSEVVAAANDIINNDFNNTPPPYAQ